MSEEQTSRKAKIKQAIAERQERFYSWEPGDTVDGPFRCWHIEPYGLISERQCMARAYNPKRWKCSNRCPRWKHYRKEVEKEIRKAKKRLGMGGFPLPPKGGAK